MGILSPIVCRRKDEKKRRSVSAAAFSDCRSVIGRREWLLVNFG